MADISPTSNTDIQDSTTVNDTGDLDNKSASDSTSQYSGTATPPDEPINADQDTQPQAQAATQTPQTPQQTAAQFPFPANQGKEIAQSINQTPDKSPDYSNHPAVQRAGLLNAIGTALAGGPRFQTTIDPNTGEMKHTAVPLSKADIGMAIAAEAIQGSLAGLSVANGPGNLGRAAAAGGAATMQAREKVDQQQNAEATANYARQVQITHTNMLMHQNALQAGRLDREASDKIVARAQPTVDMLMKDHPEVIKGHATEADFAKYNVTKDMAIPYKTVERLDPTTGKQATNSYGEPQWDMDYLIVDPSFKAGNLLTDQDKKDAAYWGFGGFADRDGKPTDLPKDIPMSLAMSNGITSKLTAGHVAKDTVDSYYKELNTHAAGGSQSVFDMFKDTKSLSDFIESHEGSKPTDRSVRNNNPGNIIETPSWKGEVDREKLAPEQNGKGYRIYDTKEEGRQALEDLVDSYKAKNPNMTPEQFFKKWDATNPAAYAAEARKVAGVAAPVSDVEAYKPVDVREAIHNDPKLLDTLMKFNPLLEASGGNYQKAIGALGKQDPSGAGKMINLLGGSDALRAYDDKRALDQKAALQTQKNEEARSQFQAMEPLRVKQIADEETARETAKNAVADKKLHDQINQAAGETPDATGARPTFISSLDPGEANLLKAIATGQQRVSSMGLSRTQQIDLAAKVQAAYPGFSQATANNYFKAGEDVNTGRKNLDQANVAFEHLGEYFDAAGRAGYFGTTPGLSYLTKNFGPQGQKQAVIDYTQARDRAGQEIEAAYKGAGLTDKDAAHQKDLFMAATPETARDIAVAASKLLTAKFSAVDSRLAGVMPSSETPIQDLMSRKAHEGYRLIHNGQDYDAAQAQRANQTQYGTWYGRPTLEKLQDANGGTSGNGQFNQPQNQNAPPKLDPRTPQGSVPAWSKSTGQQIGYQGPDGKLVRF